MNRTIRAVLMLALLAATPLLAGESLWTEDFEAAKATAAKDGKDLLMDFTGSDWCGWCIKLKKEVFDLDEFKTEAPKKFVLVELDYPQKKPQEQKLKDQNAKLSEQYGIEGYPSIMLADAKGRPYARTGYEEGGAKKYVAMLGELVLKKTVRDETLAKAEKASGLEKAKLLEHALLQLENDGVANAYSDLVDQIIALDAKNEAGLKAKYETRKKFDEITGAADKGDMPGAMAKIEALLKEPGLTGDNKQQAYFIKAALLMSAKKEQAEVLKALEAARDASPNSDQAPKLTAIIAEMKKKAAATETPEAKAEPKK
jgi:thioredoxin-related protein